MNNGEYICPLCVTPLVKNKKKLGEFLNWLKCPSCGLRFREIELYNENTKQIEELNEIINKSHFNGGYKKPQP